MVAEMFDPITPERATAPNLLDVVNAYMLYLDEHAAFDGTDETREAKVASSLRYCERVITYYLSFLPIQRPISDSDVSMACEMLHEARSTYVDTYPVPDLLRAARSLAQDARRGSKRSSTPPTTRPPLPGTPVSPQPQQYSLFMEIAARGAAHLDDTDA